MTINLVQPHELNTSVVDREYLADLLNAVLSGLGTVTVSMTYNKQTTAKPRRAGVDYRPMPGMDPTVQLGQIVRVFRTKDGLVRFTLASHTRGLENEPTGYTAIIPEGITSLSVLAAPTPQALQAVRTMRQLQAQAVQR